MRRPNVLPSVVLLVIVSLILGVSPVGAEDANTNAAYSVTVSPVRLELLASPGQSVEATVQVTNGGAGTVTLTSEVVDFTAQDESGKPLFVPSEQSEWSMSKWVTCDPLSLELKSGEKKTVSLRVTVPPDGEPGGHYAVVLFSTAPSAQGKTAVVAKVGTLLLLKVSGDIKEAGSASLQAPWLIAKGPLAATVRFKNGGNVHVAPTGSLTIRALGGSQVASMSIGEGNVLPKSTRAFPVVWKHVPTFGVFRVTAALTYGNTGEAHTSTRTVIVAPWPYILAGIGIFLAGLVPGLLLRRRRT